MLELSRCIKELIDQEDLFAAVEAVHTRGMELEIAARHSAVVSDLYWKAHDIHAVVVMGQAGILYCLTQALAAGQPGHVAQKLQSAAKALAYDVGSFTWPGWDEPKIHPTSDQLVFGKQCAKLSLRLAVELNKPVDRVSMAHWLVGAHELPSGNFNEAARSFQVACELLPQGHMMRPLNLGYRLIAQLCKEPGEVKATAEYDDITKRLSQNGDDDSRSFLNQLQTARRVFSSI